MDASRRLRRCGTRCVFRFAVRLLPLLGIVLLVAPAVHADRRAAVESLFPTDSERVMHHFGHLRTAGPEQIVDSILILERNGRFPEADELRRQFLDGRVGQGRDPFAAIAEAEESARRARLAELRAQLSHQNERFLALMATGIPWPPSERSAYQALVEELLTLARMPVITDEERRDTRRELLDSLLRARAVRYGS